MRISIKAIIFLLALTSYLVACTREPEPTSRVTNADVAQIATGLARLNAQVDTAEGIRAVKRLQWAYGHYSEFGLWYDFADLFADTGVGHYVQGDMNREEIRSLFFDQVGQGSLGLAEGRIYPHISFSPVVTIGEDDTQILGRFRILAMLGGYGGNAIWFHGVYENAYVKEGGVWKLNETSNAAQVTGNFTSGLAAPAGQALNVPVIPYHYAPAQLGSAFVPEQAAPASTLVSNTGGSEGLALQQETELSEVLHRLGRLEDEAQLLNLQHQFGYYFDSHKWDELTQLFSTEASFELGQLGVYSGKASIRQALKQFGAQGIGSGEVDDHILLQPYISIAPDGLSAKVRVDQLGMQGKVGVSAQWTQGIYENTFVREGGQWRIQALHYYPRLITDYDKGWGADAQPAPEPSADFPPDAPATERFATYPRFYIPAYHFSHPVTGRAPQYPEGDPANSKSTGFKDAQQTTNSISLVGDSSSLLLQLETAQAKVQQVLSRDAVENLVNAYAYYLDDCQVQQAAELFADTGENEIPGIGYYIGAERIAQSLQQAYCVDKTETSGISLHHVVQPVIKVSEDGNNASFQTRLWQVHAATEGDDYYLAGMLEGAAIRDNGRWRLSSLSTRYTWVAAVDEGWAHATKNAELAYAAPEGMLASYPPDRAGTSARLAPD